MSWNTTKDKLGGYACLKHSVTQELAIFGTGGQIYQIGPKTFGVIRYTASGDESLTVVKGAKCPKTYLTKLGVPATPEGQLKLTSGLI